MTTPTPVPLPTAPVLDPIGSTMTGPVVNLDQLSGTLTDIMKGVKFWTNAPFDHVMHFLLASVVGLLAYYLTWTILSLAVSLLAALLPGGKSLPAQLGSSMNRCCWSVALFAAFASHLWWDGLLP